MNRISAGRRAIIEEIKSEMTPAGRAAFREYVEDVRLALIARAPGTRIPVEHVEEVIFEALIFVDDPTGRRRAGVLQRYIETNSKGEEE